MNHRSKIPGYYQTTCFIKNTSMNIVSVKNTTKKCRVTYYSNNETFVVHRKEVGLPNMEFRMKSLVVHLYHPNEPNESNRTFINTVSVNMKSFTKIKSGEKNSKTTIRQAVVSIQYGLHMDDTEKSHQEL